MCQTARRTGVGQVLHRLSSIARRGALGHIHNGQMTAALPSTSLPPARLPRSRRVLLLVDFINPPDFPGGDKLERELIICGLATDMCVQMTASDAFLREFQTWVPGDCTAAE